MKKTILAILAPALLGLVILSLSGCQTMKGLEMTAKGIAEDVGGENGLWQNAVKADNWLQKNFW